MRWSWISALFLVTTTTPRTLVTATGPATSVTTTTPRTLVTATTSSLATSGATSGLNITIPGRFHYRHDMSAASWGEALHSCKANCRPGSNHSAPTITEPYLFRADDNVSWMQLDWKANGSEWIWSAEGSVSVPNANTALSCSGTSETISSCCVLWHHRNWNICSTDIKHDFVCFCDQMSDPGGDMRASAEPPPTPHKVIPHPTSALGIPSTVTTTTPRTPVRATTSSLATSGATSAKLKLVQQNVTWNDALSYCRKNHVELVSASTEDLQKSVAEVVKNASTEHVWLGLRFSILGFWFWVSGEGVCYQNWGPNQEGKHGHTGAVEYHENHSWVSLPETEKLNFICFT